MQIRLAYLMGLLFVLGCFQSQPSPPAFVPPHATIEIFATSPKAGPNTKPATDPLSRATIHLVTPPVVTNADISGVAKTEMTVETVGGVAPSTTVPALDVRLNATGSPKLLAATTNPASPSIAVVVNGTVICVPKIRQPISDSFRITGDDTFINAIPSVTGQTN
ncbi:preprotein translocase subunit SecD [Novipirellula galeiformis]|uniref:Preprotein translocase subunit SecD n=2 Tax=Novipirellula galeiformis TaxID=2528004 RepID=A0A5C6BXU6_9BACT|nr:preprotein translocase subunit SecD [Novipirellula galeiformis]